MIYLDNAATTLHRPPEVMDAVVKAMQTVGNAARGAHGASLGAAGAVYDTRKKLAALFGCPRADHVAFTANATGALNIAIYASAWCARARAISMCARPRRRFPFSRSA